MADKTPLSVTETVAIFLAVVGVLLVLIVPPLSVKIMGALLCAIALCWLVFRSPWTHRWRRSRQYAVSLVVLLIVGGLTIPQFVSQWRTEHPKPKAVEAAKTPAEIPPRVIAPTVAVPDVAAKPKPRKVRKQPVQQAAEREPLEPHLFVYNNKFRNNTSTILPPPGGNPTPPEINLGGHHNKAENNRMETGKINFPNGSHDNLASGNTLVRWTWTRYIADLEEALVHPKPNMPPMPGPADDMEMLKWDMNRDYWLGLPADERDKKTAIFINVIKRVRDAGSDQTKLLEVLEDLKKNPPQCLPPNWN